MTITAEPAAAVYSETTPCARGPRCAERDYRGNPKQGPRAFCGTDREWVARATGSLPEDYVMLWQLLPPSMQRRERVSGSRDTLALRAGVQALMRTLVHVACSWEEHVAAVARLSMPPYGHRRDPQALAHATRTLTAHLDTLLALPEVEVTRYRSPADLRGMGTLGYEPWVRWDMAGDAWEYTPMDGAAAGLELLDLHDQVRVVCGLTRQRRDIAEVPCDDCGALALVQREAASGGWEPVARCRVCPNVYDGDRFTLLMGRVYETQARALRQQAH